MSEKKMRELRRRIRKEFGGLKRDDKGGRQTPSYQEYTKAKKRDK